MVKAIIFDCFGVLTTDSWRAFCDALPGTADVMKAHELNRQYNAGIINRNEFLTGVNEATGYSHEHVAHLIDNETAKNTALLDYIEVLGKDYRIGLLSNIASNWINDTFLTPSEQELFDAMVLSFEVGLTKPDPRIFTLICEQLKVVPEECVFIDDNQRFCDAAQELGMKTITYTDFNAMRSKLIQVLH